MKKGITYDECKGCKFDCPRLRKLRIENKELKKDNQIYRKLVKKEFEEFKKNDGENKI